MSSLPVVVPPKPERKVSVLEQLKKLDEQRAKLLGDAKAEALKKAQDAIAELNELGFTYSLNEGNGAKKAKTGTRKKSSDTPCSVCKFITDPPHDGRQHRNQETKKPFTAKELADLGLVKR